MARSPQAIVAGQVAGQEGFEPTTAGFGDRCSTNWSYWPVKESGLFGLLVQRVFAIPTAILLFFDLVGMLFLIAEGGVVLPIAFGALEANHISHNSSTSA